MNFAQFVEWAFYGIVGTCTIFGTKSIMDLNINIAVLIERISNHDKRISALEDER